MAVSPAGVAGKQSSSDEAERLSQDAEECRSLLEANPNDASLLLRMGTIERRRGRPVEASQWYEKALISRPSDSETWRHYGAALLMQGRCADAAHVLKRAVALDPTIAETHYHLGIALKGCGMVVEAFDAFRRAHALQPDYPEVLNELGNMLQEHGKPAEARICLERAIQLDPRSAAAVNNLGIVCCSLGHLDAAAGYFRRALDLKPDFPEAYNNLGTVFRMLGATEESTACVVQALTLRPDYPDALLNLGNLLNESGRLPEAVAALERAVSLKPGSPDLHRNLGFFLLAAGRLEEGWREYEWRWQCRDVAPSIPPFKVPCWRGEPGEGRTLLLWAEQGFGDTIQFCRYAPLAAERNLRVLLMVQPPLVKLVQSLRGVEAVMGDGRNLPSFDLHCPLLSLPLAFGTGLESIPADIPYLAPGKEVVSAWEQRLPANPSGLLRVGLAWAGNPTLHAQVDGSVDRKRSISPELLAPLVEVDGIQFFNLQKDGPPAPAEFGLIDFMNECADFTDTAALIANLDLVISVDTAVVHLAGALGKPVWVLNRFDSCWRWLREREDSPWYPSLRLFRQPRPGDWGSVIARVRDELKNGLVAPWSRPFGP